MSSPAQTKTGLKFNRLLSKQDIHPLDAVEWELREASIQDAKGNTIFAQQNVDVPAVWSQTATNIVA
jgi:ribonucleoside-diphosphate reductase alpha chain